MFALNYDAMCITIIDFFLSNLSQNVTVLYISLLLIFAR